MLRGGGRGSERQQYLAAKGYIMQIWSKSTCAVAALVVAGTLCFADTAAAANYRLEITAPRSDLPSQHRMFKAYPGLLFNIRAGVVGGAYPYTFSLRNAPSGMGIDSRTGEISWTNPSANATPTLVVRDAEGTEITQTWTIVVSAAPFKFVDASNGSSSGSGTISSPWRTLADVYARGGPNDIVYFRRGTYTTSGIPTEESGTELRVDFSQDGTGGKPVMWVAYPGEAPVLDFGYTGSATPRIRLGGHTIYVEGFEATRIYVMGFQVFHNGGRGSIFRKMNMHDLVVGGNGTNSAFIMTGLVTPLGYGMIVQDSRFYRNGGTSAALKFYWTDRLLVENSQIYDTSTEALAVKQNNRQFTIRGNTFWNNNGSAIGGNMQDANDGGHEHYGEICFNNVRPTSTLAAVRVNQNSDSGAVFVYRNTFQGRVLMQFADSADGPFYFNYNVIVNNDAGTPAGSHIYFDGVTAPSRIIIANNLVGYPSNNVVDGSGNLTSGYLNYVNTHGHSSLSSTPSTPPLPVAPTNVRVVR